jgi:hypothetical protein
MSFGSKADAVRRLTGEKSHPRNTFSKIVSASSFGVACGYYLPFDEPTGELGPIQKSVAVPSIMPGV